MKLSRLSIPYRGLSSSIKLLAVTIFFSGGALAEMAPGTLVLLSVMFLGVVGLSFLYSYLYWRNFDYSFTEDGLKISHGVIRKNERDIPLSRIQNVDVKRNLVHRILGISVVKLETAGGNSTEASLRYVDLEESKDIKRKVREFKKQSEKEEEDEQEETEREMLYSIDSSELALLGFTAIDTRILVGLFAVILFSTPSIAPLLNDAGIGILAGITTVLTVGLIIVFVSNFVTTIGKYYGFKLYRERDTLEYERGLFNRAEGSIPLNKLQRVVISDNPLKRMISRSSLSIETAGYTVDKAQDMELAIPLAREERINNFVKDLEEVDAFHLEDIPFRSLRRYITRYVILSTVLAAGLYITGLLNYVIIAGLALISAVAAYMKWLHTGFLEAERHFITRRGFWKRSTVIVPYYRTQNVIMTDTVFQRMWDLSTVTLDIAGTGMIGGDAKAADIDTSRARELSKNLHDSFHRSLDKE